MIDTARQAVIVVFDSQAAKLLGECLKFAL